MGFYFTRIPNWKFLVAPRSTDDLSSSLLDGKQQKSLNNGYFLLDGQQRTRSILLGFSPTNSARLWIDLNPDLNFDSQ